MMARINVRALLWLAGAAVMLSTLSAAEARTLDEILSAGKVRVGVNPNIPPAAQFDEKNEIVGFEVDIARKLADMLGVKVDFVTVGPNSRIPFVTSDKIDFVMAEMTRTPDRAKLIQFTVPINTEGFAVLTTRDQPYKNVGEMNTDQMTFAEVRGTTPVPYIQQNLSKAKLLLLEDWPDALRAVTAGRANAVIADSGVLGDLMTKVPNDRWNILRAKFGPVYYDCLGVAKGNDSLRQWLNVALFQMQSDGFIDESWKKWYRIEMSPPIEPQPYF